MWRRTGRILLTVVMGFIACLSFGMNEVRAEDVSFTANVDRKEISLKEAVTLILTVKSGVTSSLPEPLLGQLDDFEVEGTSSQSSSSISFINGDLTSEKAITYLYQLIPRRTGQLTIPSATLVYDGKKYRTDPISIRVSEGAGEPKPQESPSGQAVAHAPSEVFIHAAANKKRAFTEEGVIVEYTLYSTLTIQDVNLIELPEAGGFWWEEDPSFSEGRGGKEVVNGKVYAVYPLKRYILYPFSPGEKRIDPMQLGCRVRVRTGDVFDAFSIFGRDKNITVASEPITLRVLPLPEEGRPPGFQGAVGNFSVRAEMDKSEVHADEAVSLRVTVEGEGNFKTMGPPLVEFPEGISSYPPDEKVETVFARDSLRGKKVFEYVLIPRAAGNYEIGTVDFPSFDPERGSYVTAHAGPLRLSVREGAFAARGAAGSDAETLLLGEDIHYIKETPPDLRVRGSLSSPAVTFLVSNLLSALLFFGFLLQRKRAEKIMGNRALRRYRSSRKVLGRTLKEARSHLGQENHELFSQRCEKAVVDFIGDRLDEETTGMTVKELAALLGSRQVEKDTLALFSEWHDLCQEARFSPHGGKKEDAEELLRKTRSLAEKLEEALQ
jgi:hypothetical protein